MRIRLAQVADAQGIARVHVDSWRTTYQGILPADFLYHLSYERREQGWRESITNTDTQQCLYVAEDEHGNVVGFACGGPEREQDPDYQGELYAIYLIENYQRQGIGEKLTRTTARHLQGLGFNSMLVWVLADNPSRGFYERLGGKITSEKEITIGTTTLTEVSYGWPDIRLITETGISGEHAHG